MKHVFTIHYIILFLLVLLSGCHSKEGLREEVISLYERGKQWEEAAQADSAADYYLQSFQLAKELKEDSLAGIIGNTLGDILNLQSLYNHAISVHQEAFLYNNRLRDKTAASHSLRGIGKDYFLNMSEDSILYHVRLDSALKYFNKARNLEPQIKSQEEISLLYNNLCAYYMKIEEFSKALDFNQKAISTTNDSITLFRNYFCRGNLYSSFAQYDSAIYYCRKAMESSNLYTKYAGCYQLANIFTLMGSPDSAIYTKKVYEIHGQIEEQNREEEIMLLLQKSSQDQLTKKRMIVFSCTIFTLILIAFSIFILYKKHNRKKLLKKDHVIFSQQEELVTEQKQTRNLRRKLEDSKKITNYAEFKEQRLNEEAKIMAKLIHLGVECAVRFRKDPFYEKMIEGLNPNFNNEDRECLFRKVNQYFMPYVKEVSKYIQLADEDYLLCCLALVGFSTKHCSFCRGVGEGAIRVQRKRIKEKLQIFFYSEEFYNSIFGRKSG